MQLDLVLIPTKYCSLLLHLKFCEEKSQKIIELSDFGIQTQVFHDTQGLEMTPSIEKRDYAGMTRTFHSKPMSPPPPSIH